MVRLIRADRSKTRFDKWQPCGRWCRSVGRSPQDDYKGDYTCEGRATNGPTGAFISESATNGSVSLLPDCTGKYGTYL